MLERVAIPVSCPMALVGSIPPSSIPVGAILMNRWRMYVWGRELCRKA